MSEIQNDNGENIHQGVWHKYCLAIYQLKMPTRQSGKLCDPSSHQFRELHSVWDQLFQELHRKGIGAVRRQSEIITITEELSMRDSGVLETHSASALLNNIFKKKIYFLMMSWKAWLLRIWKTAPSILIFKKVNSTQCYNFSLLAKN